MQVYIFNTLRPSKKLLV